MRVLLGTIAASSALIACGGEFEEEEVNVASEEAALFARGFGGQYIDCDEFAGVGLAPFAAAAAEVPSDYTVLEPVPGFALVVAQGGNCREINVNGRFRRAGSFAQFGVGVVPPTGAGDGNFYQLMFATTHGGLATRLRVLGVNARWTPRMTYTLVPTGNGQANLDIAVPRPLGLAWNVSGPVTLPNPNDTPNPLTTFNYWYKTRRNGNILQRNAVTGIIFGAGPGVVLDPIGADLAAITGPGPVSFPFFSNPEIFDRTDLSVQTNVF